MEKLSFLVSALRSGGVRGHVGAAPCHWYFLPLLGSDFRSVLAEGQLWAVFGASVWRALPAHPRKVLLQTQLKDPGH